MVECSLEGVLGILSCKLPLEAEAGLVPILILVGITKEILARRIAYLSELSDSRALEGDAWHHRSDAITSAAAAIGISVALIGGSRYAAADDWGALLACVVILFNGGRLVLRSVNENIDGTVVSEVIQSIRSLAADVDGVRGIEKCRVRKSGSFYLAEIHVQVDLACSVAVGHEISHRVKAHLVDRMPNLQEVVIHLEPFSATAGQSRGGHSSPRVAQD